MGSEIEARLHRQMEDLVRSRMGQLEQEISRLQRELNHSFTTLLELTDAAATIPETDQGLAKVLAEVEGQIGQAAAQSARLGSDLALLRDAVEELGKQATQAEVLNSLVERAGAFSPRVVLFVVKGSNALGWAAKGLDESLGKNAVRGLSIPLQADTVLKSAADSQQTFYSPPDQQKENSLVTGRLGNESPDRVLTVPLKVRGKCAALLYADSASNGAAAVNVEAIELLVSTTGLVVELTSLRGRVTEGAVQPQAAAEAKPQKPATGSLTQQPPQSVPLPPQAPPVAPQPAFQSQPVPAAPSYTAGGSGELRQPAYFKPVAEPQAPPAFQPPPVQPQAEAPRQPERPAPPRPPMDEEEKQHNDARRFARLLVSEIKLYNEQKVQEGRQSRDLYERLKDDIDRSRQVYDKRISPSVANKFDYFYDELVNTLAEGDPAKLGSGHPGPSVRVM